MVSPKHGDKKKKKKKKNWWCGGQYDGRDPNRVLIVQDSMDPSEANVFQAHPALQKCVCEHLLNALQLLANQQMGGDTPVEVLVEELLERSRLKMMEELRRFIMVGQLEAVKIGARSSGS